MFINDWESEIVPQHKCLTPQNIEQVRESKARGSLREASVE